MVRGITLEHLAQRAPGMPWGMAEHYQHSCMICLNDHHHISGVQMDVHFLEELTTFSVYWQGAVTEAMRRWLRDQNKSVDLGACAIALLLIPELLPLMPVEQSETGDGVDYYLAEVSEDAGDNDLIFNTGYAAHLEISGIHSETSTNTIDARIADKRRRLRAIRSGSASRTRDLPTYVCVVEFSRPTTKVVLA
jgi:hypothetical protein